MEKGVARSDAPPLNATRRFSDWQVIAGMFRGRERGERRERERETERSLGVFQVHV